ncbi:MAG TPA: homoserine dehydrogenase [Marinilabiliales bacterium]|jgi:homoserine dehydrogenase|nr:MAG: homoserine dehydrogenase [Bacteroidetes bacterium GWA2_40_14]OFX66183.1 MAG: homoserine dehydrogenase [Bacteroidetes bacterium GWC2_40_13]OFX74527.1 MAG: homoserine dehydrogenase [Bacteroidetes bacterium GWD2_40_43]OFX92040.1 MAG: homoserine dehydrogenase [Bacteroidetes bacterium GWE2_40_63]OFY16664.1 MAG: homoserine dehydrogenase [Bacteroidetes bacterium GWF2_40_13]OFZ27038.1 MAG: homoserine dehydrogenase [Bacteroidetes bacterium RIFOXYC2_FULL_40_12]HAM98878.1 homoserine dehydrogenas
MNTQIKIGLIGFGTVGQGLYEVLEKSPNARASIKRICIKSKDKTRKLDSGIFTFHFDDLLNDPEINLIVELIDNADDAYQMVKKSLQQGISVVSGNKKMIATHITELIRLQKEHKTALLYDASACGSIPVIRNLEEYYDNDLLKSITGILNGSSNFILTRIFNDKMEYSKALKLAQELGFAESNPVFDVEGFDSLYKLVILAVHGFGTVVNPDDVLNYGISKISGFDIQYAREKGYRIKLVAQVTKIRKDEITLYVLPRLVTPDKYIYGVEDEFNGVVIQGEAYDKQFMFGKGAGGHPTGSAVLSDITARLHNYKYEYKKQKYFTVPTYSTNHALRIYLRYSNSLDFSHFDFEEIQERYTSKQNSYVIGIIKLENLLKIKKLLPKLDVFIAYLGDMVNTY